MKKPSTLVGRVKPLLEKNHHLRDSDVRLVCNVWVAELRDLGYHYNTMTAKQMMDLIIEGPLTNSDTITRCRRKVQEEHPGLRGRTHKYRQDRQEDIKDDLRNFPKDDDDEGIVDKDGQTNLF